LKLWDAKSRRELKTFTGHRSPVISVAFSPDGKLVLFGSKDYTLKLWDVESGQELKTFVGHTAAVTSVAFSPDRHKILSGSDDGTVRLWSVHSGKELINMMASQNGDQLAITKEGFFIASRRETDLLAVVRGFEVTTIGQVHLSLYNPDLVREALAGDPTGEVARAAEVINLDKVLDSGPAPQVEITSHSAASKSGTDLVTVAARTTDKGKGIGRIEWRVNGITVGVASAPEDAGAIYEATQSLALEPGENRIEIVGYNKSDLLASVPAQTMITYTGSADKVQPKLYVLSIGISDYIDQGGSEPGTGKILAFPPLAASVPDAKAFSAEMEKAGAALYSEVRVTKALDADATIAKLDETFKKLASEISPRDTFVLYAAAHGYSLGGNYYMIPLGLSGRARLGGN
jgi:WD domain, G-beta repeat